MSRRSFALLAVALLLPAIAVSAQPVELGYASWYNRGFHGLATASGDAYDHEAMTAAHPSLPFNTMIRITRVDTDKSVMVRVNDRMQSGPGHVVDLSGAAARTLGMYESGVAKVRLEVVGEGEATEWSRPARGTDVDTTPSEGPSEYRPASVSTTPTPGSITLQLGVFSSSDAAERLATGFEGTWVQTVDSANGRLYRVYYQRFESETAARTAQSRLWSAGYDSFLRRF